MRGGMREVMRYAMVLGLLFAMGMAGAQAATVFNAPGFSYTKVLDGGGAKLSSAAFSPDGRYIAYYERNSAGNTLAIKVYDRQTQTTTTLLSDQYSDRWMSAPYFSDDGTKVGFSYWPGGSVPNEIRVYSLDGTSFQTYESDVFEPANSDFLGSATDKFVAWDWNEEPNTEADLITYDGSSTPSNMTRTNITNTAAYSEYEPDSNRAGDMILYWSGETTAEAVDTTHTLTNVEGVWTVDVDFNPIAGSTWAFLSRDETEIGLTQYDSGSGYGKGDLYVYDLAGNFLFDLTGPAVGQGEYWQFFGFNFATGPEGPGREYVFTSDADNSLGGRDIWVATAVPEPTTLLLVASGLAGLMGVARRRRR